MTETGSSVLVWKPSEPPLLNRDGELTEPELASPRAFGATGFGPDVAEVEKLTWDRISEGDRMPDVVLIGRDGPFRTEVVRTLMETYPVELVGRPEVHSVNDLDGVKRIFEDFGRMVEDERDGLMREACLVVIDVERFPKEEQDGQEILSLAQMISLRGYRHGWSLLLVSESGKFVLRRRLSSGIIAIESFLLEGITPSLEAGSRLNEALRGGLFTPEGIEAVIGGAPVEWARGFEHGAPL